MLRLGRGGLHGARDLRRQLRDDERHEARRVQRAAAGGGGGAHAAQGALAQPCGGEGSGVRHYLDNSFQCIYYLPSSLLLSTPKPSCPDDKEDVESNLFPEAEDSEEKLCWLETEAVEAVEEDEAPTAAWTAWATWGWMASRICCTRLPLAREAWEEKEESWEAVRDEEEEEEELEEEEETDNSLVAFST